MKLICYISYGAGDSYDLFTILPDFIEKRKVNSVKFYVDSIYFLSNNFSSQRTATIKMINTITDDYEIVPEEFSSHQQLYYGKEDRTLGPQYDKIKNTFLFYRKPETISYIKDKLKECDLFLYSVMGINFTYEWKDNTNISLLEYSRKPLSLSVSNENRNRVSNLLKEYNVLLQVRKKGISETDKYFKNLYSILIDRGFKVLCINLDNVDIPNAEDFSYLSFESVMYLTEKIKYMICSSSVLGCHRIHFNKKTIINTPYRNGSNEVIFTDYIDNPNYLFLNSEIDNTEIIKKEIDTWNY